MKRLEKMLLINWHYIRHELLEFKDINFLTGKNGAGKSTIIDALQLLLLGDTTGHFFNKAANERSNRTLKGYLRGEVAEDEEANIVYLRGDRDFSSYIVLEFRDTVEEKRFSLGVVFDSYSDGDIKHQFFYLKDVIPSHHFCIDNVPMNIKTLKAYFYNHYPKQYDFFETNRDFRDVMAGVMGHLNERFFRLFKKAVPFSPIMDIKGFITEFVCDVPNEVDITHMQETIRQYKQLEEELGLVEKRVQALEGIAGQYEAFSEEEQRFLVQKYLIDRSREEKSGDDLRELEQEIAQLGERIARLQEVIARGEEEQAELQRQRDGLLQERARSDLYKQQQDLLREKEILETKLERIKNSESRLHRMLEAHLRSWSEVAAWCASNLAGEERPVPEPERMKEELAMLESARQEYSLLEYDRLGSLKSALEQFADGLDRFYFTWEQAREEYKKRLETLARELQGLKRGIKPYSPSLLALQEAIAAELSEKYGKEIKPRIFAELLEVRDPKWHNAVEAYLHSQKFYLLVEPQYFVEALRIYDRLKFERKFFDLGLVDLEKVMEQQRQVLPGSLAEEVETDDPLARSYADFLLGRVVKCETVEELRAHRTAITPSCMLYHNFVARQLNPRRYETPYIGRKAIARMIEQKEREQEEKERLLAALTPKLAELGKMKNTPLLTENDITVLLSLKNEAVAREETERGLQAVLDALGRLDLSYLVALENRLKECEEKIQIVKERLERQKGDLREAMVLKAEREKMVPALQEERQQNRALLEQAYDAAWRDNIGEPRFLQELKSRKSAAHIYNAFTAAIKGTETKKQTKWDLLVNLRTDYNRDFKGSFSVTAPHNDAYDGELRRLKDTLLLEYREKIREAKERAQVQFQEDFISKLRANISEVMEQINDLNKAIKDNFFGRDRYKFTVTPNKHYRRFYDMITDEMLMEGYNLFSYNFQQRHGDTVSELFRQIVDIGEGVLTADQRQRLSENLEKFTDYRTYLDFDMVNVDDEGRESRLSRVIAKKSGGETQTPFYIAVLASFLQLYRVRQPDANTLRLIVFDEAYSKMDHQRIQESIKLIREMGLQVILSAPTEKIGDIAPLVDRNLCVTRVKNVTIVRAFDPKEMLEMGA